MTEARSRTVRVARVAVEGAALPAAFEACPPQGLNVASFCVDGDEFAVLDWPTAGTLPASLTPAEQEVVELAREGLSNLEIASARGTSLRTVANQLSAAYRKLGIGSRLELFALGGRDPR